MEEHGGNIEKALKEYRIKEGALIDFSANINPLDMPYSVRKAIIDKLKYAQRYPEPGYNELKKHLADFYKVRLEEMLPDNGSISLIYLIPRALGLTKPCIPIPTFSEYEKSFLLSGAKPMFIKPTQDLSLAMDAIIRCLGQGKIDSLYLCNPNNPTGLSIPKEDVVKILKAAKKKKVTVIVDEVFVEFTDAPKKHSVIEEARNFKNVVILRSMTKYFGLAGLRLGTAIANEGIIKRLKAHQPPWAVNTVAVSAAIAFLKNAKYARDSHHLISSEKKFFYDSLSGFTLLQVWKPSANFIFCRIKDKKLKAAVLKNRLAKRGILIRDCANFRGLDSSFFRVAVRTRPENERLISELKNLGVGAGPRACPKQ